MMNESQLLSQFEDYIINDLRLKRINCCIKYDKQNGKLILGIFDKKVYQETIQNIQENLINHQGTQVVNSEKNKHSTTQNNNYNYYNFGHHDTQEQTRDDKEMNELIASLNNLNQICNKVDCSAIQQQNYVLTNINVDDEKQNKELQKAKEQQISLFIKCQTLTSQDNDKTNTSSSDFSHQNAKNFFNTKLENLSLKHKFDSSHHFFSFANSLVVVKYVDFDLYQQLMKNDDAIKNSYTYTHPSVKNTIIDAEMQKPINLHFEEVNQIKKEKNNKQSLAPVCMNADIYHSIYKNTSNETEDNSSNINTTHKHTVHSNSFNDKIHEVNKNIASETNQTFVKNPHKKSVMI